MTVGGSGAKRDPARTGRGPIYGERREKRIQEEIQREPVLGARVFITLLLASMPQLASLLKLITVNRLANLLSEETSLLSNLFFSNTDTGLKKVRIGGLITAAQKEIL